MTAIVQSLTVLKVYFNLISGKFCKSRLKKKKQLKFNEKKSSNQNSKKLAVSKVY